MRKLLLCLLLPLLPTFALANQRYNGTCATSGKIVTSGLNSTNTALLTFPSSTVTVTVVGGGIATIFSDNSGTALANPFTAASDGTFFFYAANGRFNASCSTPTINFLDILLNDPTGGSGPFTSTFFASASTPVAATGVFRLASSDLGPCWRNNANSADLCLSKTSGDVLTWPGAFSITTNPITAGTWISNTANPAASGTQRWANADNAKIRNSANSLDLNLWDLIAGDSLQLGDTPGITVPGPAVMSTVTSTSLNGPLGTTTPAAVIATTGTFSGPVSASNLPANPAGKNAATDRFVYVSSTGNDTNDGLSWGTAKLTLQAAFNLATISGTVPGNIQAACGTYTGPTTWYGNMQLTGMGAADATANNFGAPSSGTPCVKVTYTSTVTLTGLQNLFIRNVYFDFANTGAGFVLNSVASSHFDDDTFNQCGNATTPCVLLKTIGTGGPAQNTMLNVFRGTRVIGNNGGGGLNATGFKLLGQGVVNCAGACGAVTLNEFYNTLCAGGVLHCVDFELNSDTNRFYELNCNQDVPIAGSSCLSFNELIPASDQDADGEVVFNMCITGTFSAQIRAGQTNGSVVNSCIGASGLPSVTILGGTPTLDLATVGLAGTTKATQYSGTLGVAADATLGVPAGAVAGDGYVARNSTTGCMSFGTDGGQICRSGGFSYSTPAAGLANLPNVTTADGMGLVPVVGTPKHPTGQTAAITNSPLGTIGANIVTGTYLTHVSCITTTSGTGTTMTPTITWTDAGGAKTLTLASIALNSVTITGYDNAAFPIHPTSGAINLSTTGTFGTSVYACDAWLTREN